MEAYCFVGTGRIACATEKLDAARSAVHGDSMTGYMQEWARYEIRKTRIQLYVLLEFLAMLPVMWVAGTLSRRFFPTLRLGWLFSLLWGVLLLWTWTRARIFQCPRCGKSFFGRWSLGQECMHCGLQKPKRIAIKDN